MAGKERILISVGGLAAVGLCIGIGSSLWQDRDKSSPTIGPTNVPVLPTTSGAEKNPSTGGEVEITTGSAESTINVSAPTPVPESLVNSNSSELTGPCWSLPGVDGTRMSVEIGQASKYWGAICIGVSPDGATRWWYQGHESITYPFAPESPVAKTR